VGNARRMVARSLLCPGGREEYSNCCADCGKPGARFSLDGGPLLCERCYDARLSERTGYARLPEPPGPEMITGPDRRRHRIAYRIMRSPAGICVEAMEGPDRGDGYYVEIVGSHYDDVDGLVARARAAIRRRIAHPELERSPFDGHWTLAGWDLRGRLEWNDRGDPFDVIVDGRRLTWEELGRALDAYEGWEFKLGFRLGGFDEEVPGEGTGQEAATWSMAAGVETHVEMAGEEAAAADPDVDEAGGLVIVDSTHFPPPTFGRTGRPGPRIH